MQIGIVGRGAIATAMVEAVAGNGHDIAVSTRSPADSARLTERFGNVAAAENQQVVETDDLFFNGPKENVAPRTL